MKSLLLSIRPKWVAKILNDEKTIEIRKKFPKDYVGWVYIYNTKDIKDGYLTCAYIGNKLEFITSFSEHKKYRGKVVARFWCDKVEEIKLPYTKFGTNEWVGGEYERTLQTETMDEQTLLEKSCLSEEEIYKYLNFKNSPNHCGYAIHITKLEIFNKPKDISDFEREIGRDENVIAYDRLNRAPQSWCYVEV